MPINFDYSGLNVELEELDELEEYVSEGDVETDKVFAEEEGFQTDIRNHFDKVICVNHVPAGVPASKHEKLTTILTNPFKSIGTIQKDGLSLPTDSEGNTLGFCFIAFETVESAEQAIKLTNGLKFDKKHTLEVFAYSDLEKYANWTEEYQVPETPAYSPGDNLKSWLSDPAGRDQFVIRHGNNTEINWCEGMIMNAAESLAYDGERERQNGKVWCEMYVVWSPLGSLLATYHMQGVALWGGPVFNKQMRFAHKQVQHLAFSPSEKYLVTWNGKDDNKDPRALIVWDIATGCEMRAFKVSKQANGEPAEWPVMKWSSDDSFFARMLEDGISIFETSTFKLLDKKPLKAKGVQNFEWSKSDNVIAYWAPEMANMPARVVLINPLTRIEMRSKNLFSVRDVKLHWQDAGDFLCAQVLRHTKSGKTTFTNLELFRMRDANIPNEMTEVKDIVEYFAWEPKRERFGIIHGESSHRLNVSFYTTGAIKGGENVEKVYTIPNKQVSKLHWSPAGNAIIFSGNNINGHIEFWDVDANVCTAEEEHFMCNEIQWDPSGRMVATIVTQPMFGSVAMKYQLENGYIMWTFQGQMLRKQQMERFFQVSCLEMKIRSKTPGCILFPLAIGIRIA